MANAGGQRQRQWQRQRGSDSAKRPVINDYRRQQRQRQRQRQQRRRQRQRQRHCCPPPPTSMASRAAAAAQSTCSFKCNSTSRSVESLSRRWARQIKQAEACAKNKQSQQREIIPKQLNASRDFAAAVAAAVAAAANCASIATHKTWLERVSEPANVRCEVGAVERATQSEQSAA